MKLKILDKNAHWWSSERIEKWATQDKDGNWWLINGSEFPEKKMGKDMKIKDNGGERSNGCELKFLLFIMLSSFLGVFLAILLSYFVFK